MVKKTDKRIQILRKSEINELYSLPNFNHADREDYFSLDDETKKLVDKSVIPHLLYRINSNKNSSKRSRQAIFIQLNQSVVDIRR